MIGDTLLICRGPATNHVAKELSLSAKNLIRVGRNLKFIVWDKSSDKRMMDWTDDMLIDVQPTGKSLRASDGEFQITKRGLNKYAAEQGLGLGTINKWGERHWAGYNLGDLNELNYDVHDALTTH
jgi:hypothetical protein